MNISPAKWFGTRELSNVPPHFVQSSTPLTEKSKLWVVSKLQGRFATASIAEESDTLIPLPNDYIFFEDPAEAMIYELRWSGSK
jgi:hypothetical protein